MTVVYKRRKALIQQTKATMQEEGTFPAKTFEKDFAKHLKEVLQPLWKQESAAWKQQQVPVEPEPSLSELIQEVTQEQVTDEIPT